MRRKFVAGNWKMNGSLESANALVKALVASIGNSPAADVVVCPPFIHLESVAALVNGSGVSLGAQNLADEEAGAYTGEVSGAMLKDVGCEYVIIGHSERRTLYGEDDALVSKKFLRARDEGLIPILCVGESLEERESGAMESVIARQIDAVLTAAGVQALCNSVIAYEPVWAIGTGMTATPEQAQDVHAFIRSRIAAEDAAAAEGVRILYGGSANAANAATLFGQPDIDGGLIGGASLKAEDFVTICAAAA